MRFPEKVRAVVVPTPRTEEVRGRLHALGLIDRARKMSKRDGDVLIPIREDPPFDLRPYGAHVGEVDGLEVRPMARNPREELLAAFREEGLPPGVGPSRWERLGDVVIVTLPKVSWPHAAAIGRVVGRVLRARTVVADVAGIRGRLRTPEVEVLWGNGTETVHVEGGIRYRLDVSRVMFSSGNLAERMSVAGRVRAGETVVDLFAGIGYFSLPVALRAAPAAVVACELNPVAFGYLMENVRINRAERVLPRLGDCRDTAPRGVADWVLMGHFDSARRFDVAFRALRDEGTVVYHSLTSAKAYPQEPMDRVRAAARALGADVLRMEPRIVKSFAPGVDHAVVEARVRVPPKGISVPSGWTDA